MRHLLAALLIFVAAPSHARVLAVAESADGARIALHDASGPCVGAARLAEHIASNGEKVQGCWLAGASNITVSFLDGERGSIPVAHLKKPQDV